MRDIVGRARSLDRPVGVGGAGRGRLHQPAGAGRPPTHHEVPISGGRPRRLAVGTPSLSLQWPAVSPDGTEIAYTETDAKPGPITGSRSTASTAALHAGLRRRCGAGAAGAGESRSSRPQRPGAGRLAHLRPPRRARLPAAVAGPAPQPDGARCRRRLPANLAGRALDPVQPVVSPGAGGWPRRRSAVEHPGGRRQHRHARSPPIRPAAGATRGTGHRTAAASSTSTARSAGITTSCGS